MSHNTATSPREKTKQTNIKINHKENKNLRNWYFHQQVLKNSLYQTCQIRKEHFKTFQQYSNRDNGIFLSNLKQYKNRITPRHPVRLTRKN